MKNDRVISLLGLCERAGKLGSGEYASEKAVKSGSAWLVVVAADSSDNTKKKFTDMCRYYHVPILFYGDRETLGHGIGKEYRACAAVLDEGFAEAVRKAAGQDAGQPAD